MKLKELVEGNFGQLKGFLRAAVSGKYIEGRDNVGIYALPGSKRKNTLLDVYEQHGFGEVFSMAAEQETKRQKNMENSVLIRGPLNTDLVVDIWSACKYFLENTTDFHKVEGIPIGDFRNKDGEKWDYRVEAKVAGNVKDEEQIVLAVKGKNYLASMEGPLRGKKYFDFDLASDPHIILFGCLSHKNNFSFSTYDYVNGDYDFSRENNWDVHLNGPTNNFIIKDFLELGNAIRDYCLKRCEE